MGRDWISSGLSLSSWDSRGLLQLLFPHIFPSLPASSLAPSPPLTPRFHYAAVTLATYLSCLAAARFPGSIPRPLPHPQSFSAFGPWSSCVCAESSRHHPPRGHVHLRPSLQEQFCLFVVFYPLTHALVQERPKGKTKRSPFQLRVTSSPRGQGHGRGRSASWHFHCWQLGKGGDLRYNSAIPKWCLCLPRLFLWSKKGGTFQDNFDSQ